MNELNSNHDATMLDSGLGSVRLRMAGVDKLESCNATNGSVRGADPPTLQQYCGSR